MTSESAVRARNAGERDEALPAQGNLALLYEAILTSAVRLQASRQQIPDAETFKKRIKGTLKDIEQMCVSNGYDGQDIRDTHFAVVAFIDAVVLHSNDPVRADWERRLLAVDLFGQADAGDIFFEKLTNLHSRRDSEQLANILEVYLLCLLLGFEGRFSGGPRGELDSIVERTRRRIEHIRGRARELSPEGALAAATAPPESRQNQKPDRFRLIMAAAIAFTVLIFIVFRVNLIWTAEQLRSQLP